METIIYFQKKRGIQEPHIEPIGMKTYLLIRVSLDVERERWFGLGMEAPALPQFDRDVNMQEMPGVVANGRMCRRLLWKRIHPVKALRQRRENIAKRQQECDSRFEKVRDYHIRLERWQQRQQQIETDIQALVRKINELPQPEQPVWAVYEDCLKEILFNERLSVMWNQYVDYAVFRDHTGPFWIEQTLPEHLPPRFLILGRNLNICPILERCTGGLKSIHWILAQKDCTPEFLDYLEYFYEEYGMVISYHTFSDVGQLRRAELSCAEETVIFDFTREGYVQAAGVARGSIWLDMYSSEEKQKKMECRNPGVFYFSLKKKWRQIQKVRNKPFFLDTAKENGYNTWESEGIL